MRILAANVLPICFLAACVWFVQTDHAGFAIACLIGAAITSHTYREPS